MSKISKYLTKFCRPTYTQLLRIVGGNPRPMSSYQIKKEMEKAGLAESNSPYVYEMIKELLGNSFNKKLVSFPWEQVPGNKRQEQKLMNGLNLLFGLNFLKEKDISFKKSYDQQSLYTSHGSGIEIILELHDKETDGPTISLYNNNKLTKKSVMAYDRARGIIRFSPTDQTTFEHVLVSSKSFSLNSLGCDLDQRGLTYLKKSKKKERKS